MTANPLHIKLRNAARIDRALRFVWQASPFYSSVSGAVLLAMGILPLASLYLLKLIIDELGHLAASPPAGLLDPAFSKTLIYIGLACGLGLCTTFFNFLADYLRKAQSMAVSDHMFSIVHEKSSQVDLAFFESAQYRDTLFRAQQEGPYRPTRIVNGLFTAGQSGAAFVAVAWLLSVFNPIFPLIMISAVLPGICLRLRYSGKIYSWQEKRTEDERRAHYYHWMLTSDTHAEELRFFNLSRHFIHRFRELRKTLKKEKLGFERQKSMGDGIAQSCAVLSMFGSLVYIGLRTAQGQISLGDMVMYFQAFQRGVGFLKTFSESCAQMYEDNLFLSHLYDFLQVRPQIKTPDLPHPVPETLSRGIEFQNITFFYQKHEKYVLNCVNFSIKPGEVVALVGDNGSGKTTIIKLLSRLYDPASGCITLDGIDIKTFCPDDYRKKISIVFQNHIRYHLTAAENIALGDVSQSRDRKRIHDSARKSGIHEKIDALDSGYDTILGRWFKTGQELSIGQWQMLAISRAFFRNAPLVVFDEPSSALDPQTEARIFLKLKDLIQNRSALVVTHRYSTVKNADKIIVLDQGSIIEQGTHAQLMKKNGKYARMFNTQASAYVQDKECI